LGTRWLTRLLRQDLVDAGVWEAEERREKEQRSNAATAAAAAGCVVWSCWAGTGGLTGAGQEVALSVCLCPVSTAAISKPCFGAHWASSGCEGVLPRCGHRSGEPGLVLGCFLWKAGRRSVESNGVRVRVRAQARAWKMTRAARCCFPQTSPRSSGLWFIVVG
jgi:hypothetical protein